MLHDLANDGGHVALKGAADDREYGNTERMSKTCCTAANYGMMMIKDDRGGEW